MSRKEESAKKRLVKCEEFAGVFVRAYEMLRADGRLHHFSKLMANKEVLKYIEELGKKTPQEKMFLLDCKIQFASFVKNFPEPEVK